MMCFITACSVVFLRILDIDMIYFIIACSVVFLGILDLYMMYFIIACSVVFLGILDHLYCNLWKWKKRKDEAVSGGYRM